MRRSRTIEEEKAICEAYKDEDNTVREILEKYGISCYVYLRKILDKYDIPPRRRGTPINRRADVQTKQRKCPECGEAIEQAGARFCWYCGADVRSPKAVAVEGLERCVIKNLDLVTPAVRDEMAEAVRLAIRVLKQE